MHFSSANPCCDKSCSTRKKRDAVLSTFQQRKLRETGRIEPVRRTISRLLPYPSLRRFQMDYKGNASHCRRFALICRGDSQQQGKGGKIMKTKLLGLALVASAATIAQANPGNVQRGGGGSHGGAVARGAPAAHSPIRSGGVSSFRSAPARTYGGRPVSSGQRYSSFGMRSSPSFAYRRPYLLRIEVHSPVRVHTR